MASGVLAERVIMTLEEFLALPEMDVNAEIWFVYEDTKVVYVYRNYEPNFSFASSPAASKAVR